LNIVGRVVAVFAIDRVTSGILASAATSLSRWKNGSVLPEAASTLSQPPDAASSLGHK
jgi:hypothetical protein